MDWQALVQKIKSLGASFLAYLAPVFGLVAYVFYLRGHNKDLEQQVTTEKAKAESAADMEKVNEASKEADQSSADYESTKSKYLKEHPSGDDVPGRD